MSLGICPVDCMPCDQPECYVSGCIHAKEVVLFACDVCGELHAVFADPPICGECWVKLEVRVRRR